MSFDSEDSEINFDRARTTTAVNSLLRALKAGYNISSDEADEGEKFFRNGKLDTKWSSRQTKNSKDNSRTALNGIKFGHLNTRFLARVFVAV